jgi:hypothetical protein
MENRLTPPSQKLQVIQRLVIAYKLWHEIVSNFPKTSRYTLASKIDLILLEVIENTFIAGYLFNQEKLPALTKSIARLDLLKFLLKISWEIHVLDNKKYITLSEKFDEIGRMLGGWKRGLEKKTPTR